MDQILGEREESDAVIHSSAQAKETGVFLVIVGKVPCWKQTAWGQLAYRLPWVFLPWTFHPSSGLLLPRLSLPRLLLHHAVGGGRVSGGGREEVRGAGEAGMEGQRAEWGRFQTPDGFINPPHPT